MIYEAYTCRRDILPKILETGWEGSPYHFAKQKTLFDSRILVAGSKTHRTLQELRVAVYPLRGCPRQGEGASR